MSSLLFVISEILYTIESLDRKSDAICYIPILYRIKLLSFKWKWLMLSVSIWSLFCMY